MPETVEGMAWYHALDLFDYWRKFPPDHEGIVLLLARFGVNLEKAKPKFDPAANDDPSGIGGLIGMFPDGNVRAAR